MIRGMVARLADQLKQNGADVDGWQRLLRAYMVLGERDKAPPPRATRSVPWPAIRTSCASIEDVIKIAGARRVETMAMTRKQRRLILIGGSRRRARRSRSGWC